MASFKGTGANETIGPAFVSPTVATSGGSLPSEAADFIDGGGGNDVIDGGGGDDTLIGGTGNDVVTGGRGNDIAKLGDGDDRFIWNPGDGSDVVDGGLGFDTLEFNGSNVSENISIGASGSHVSLFRNVGDVTMDMTGINRIELRALGGADTVTIGDLAGTNVRQVAVDLQGSGGGGDGQADTVIVNAGAGSDHIRIAGSGSSIVVSGLYAQTTIVGAEAGNDRLVVNGLAGNDVIDASALVSGQIGLTIDGGLGNDAIVGSAGADLLLGGDGDDVVTGRGGNDTALLGSGADRFIWNPGDGSDVVEGQDGFDTLDFRGSGVAETFTLDANGSRVLLSRDVGNVTMDVNGVERIQIAPSGGADSIVIGDLLGTDISQVAIDLAASGTTHGDGQPDQVRVNAGAGGRFVTISGGGGTVTVGGLSEVVTLAHAEPGLDRLMVVAGPGDTVLDASNLAANQIGLTLVGGNGNDVIEGSQGSDSVIGGRGNDTALLGSGNDVFTWNPGDGSDLVEGGSGFDTLAFNGSNVSEHIALSAAGGQALLERDVGAVTMNLNGIERIQIQALGGADSISIGDLAGSGVQQVAIDLSGVTGGVAGDGQPDTVSLDGDDRGDHIGITASAGVVTVSGLPEQVTVSHADTGDLLAIHGGSGNDTITISPATLGAGPMTVLLDAGAGQNVLTGGNEADIFRITAAGGHDLIRSFQAHDASGHGDVISIAGFLDPTFDAAVADGHIAQAGHDVAISNNGSVVGTIQNTLLASLHAQDFLFT